MIGGGMVVDLSFISVDKLPEDLVKLSQKRIEYPYIENSNFGDIFKRGKSVSKSNVELFKTRNEYRKNYWEFEDKFFQFAVEQFKNNNIELAKKSFRYLVDIGSKMADVKEYLFRIYKMQKDVKSIRWLLMKIDQELTGGRDYHAQFSKLKGIKEKYHLYN